MTGTTDVPLRFLGQEWDAATGLSQNWHRDYDPTLGRYIESDPIGLGGGMSTYRYASSAPLNAIDRAGLYGTNRCGDYRERGLLANIHRAENLVKALDEMIPEHAPFHSTGAWIATR